MKDWPEIITTFDKNWNFSFKENPCLSKLVLRISFKVDSLSFEFFPEHARILCCLLPLHSFRPMLSGKHHLQD